MSKEFESIQSLQKSLLTIEICEQTINVIDNPTSSQTKDIHTFTQLIKSHNENVDQICTDYSLDRDSISHLHKSILDGECTFDELIENSLIGDVPEMIEEEVVDQVLKGMGYSDQLIKGRTLNVANLRRVRRQVVAANGTVYMKTMYVKKEELNNEKSERFLEQHNLEQNAAVGTLVKLRFKGESTGTIYNTSSAKIKSINDDSYVIELTHDFDTQNSNNYTYRQGHTFTIPKTTSPDWNKDKSIVAYIAPTSVATTSTPTPVVTATQPVVVSSIDQISVGDDVLIKVGDDDAVPAVIRYIHPQGKFMTIRGADGKDYRRTLGNFKKPGQVPAETVGLNATSLEQLRAMGVTVVLPGGSRIADGEEEYQTRIQVDRFGNENPRGRNSQTVTRTRTRYRNAEPHELALVNQSTFDKFNQTYPNFNMTELASEIKSKVQSGIGKEANVKFTINSGGESMGLNVTAEGLSMTRSFSKGSDGTEVYHAYFTLSAASQGGDLGKNLFQSLYKQYRNAGIAKIGVSANIDVGGYAWARYGFTATKSQAESMVNGLSPRTHRGHNLTSEHIDEMSNRIQTYYTSNPNSSRFPMNLIATVGPNNSAGKAALLGKSWSGTIDLKNTTQRTHFENYIGFS